MQIQISKVQSHCLYSQNVVSRANVDTELNYSDHDSAIGSFLLNPNPEIREIFRGTGTWHSPRFQLPESSVIRQPWVGRVRQHKKWVVV